MLYLPVSKWCFLSLRKAGCCTIFTRKLCQLRLIIHPIFYLSKILHMKKMKFFHKVRGFSIPLTAGILRKGVFLVIALVQ